MATEEFKQTMENLFEDYLDLRKLMKEKGHEQINLSFKDYLDSYISCKDDLYSISLDDDEEDETMEDM